MTTSSYSDKHSISDTVTKEPVAKRSRKTKASATNQELDNANVPIGEVDNSTKTKSATKTTKSKDQDDSKELEVQNKKAKTSKSRAKSKKNSTIDIMSKEAILAHAHEALNFEAPVLLVPLRHHSVAMGLHLHRIIDAYQPDLIAVEMPYICQDQVKHLSNSKVIPPIAFFSYGTTKTIVLAPVDENDPESALEEQEVDAAFRHVYPLLAHSPEYVALKEALSRNIDYQCIDLSSSEKDYLNAMKEQHARLKVLDDHTNQGDDERSSDEQEFAKSSHYGELIKSSGDLSFEEFWDRNFEINALAQDTNTYLQNVYSYCYCLRKGINDEQDLSMVQRELFMLKKITDAQKTYKRILVVTGGMHSVALCDYLYHKKKKEKPVKFPKSKNNCFLIPYSFKSADAQSEYASGIVFPYYYHKLYRAIEQSLSFAPDINSVLNKLTDNYLATAKQSQDFQYWNRPLDAVKLFDNNLLQSFLSESENGKEGDAQESTDKKKSKKRKPKGANVITSAGRLSDVLDTIKGLGSIKEQAKIKDINELSAKVALLTKKGNGTKLDQGKSLKLESNQDIIDLNAQQRAALLSYVADQEQLKNAFDATNFFFAHKIKNYRNQNMSTAVQIDCQVMLKGLASLRDKVAPSVYELIDAVKSTFIKEEFNEHHYILRNLLKALTTVPLGRVPLDVNVPPLWRDFVLKAKTFGLKTEDSSIHKATIDIFKDEKNVLKGQFYAQVSFLAPEFEVEQDNRYVNTNYIKRNETYTYHYTDEVVMSIIEAAEYGDTLPIACEAKLKELLEQNNMPLIGLCRIFQECVDMGIESQYYRLNKLISKTVNNERDLSAIANSLDFLNSYTLIAKTNEKNQKAINGLINKVLHRALKVIEDHRDISDEDLDQYLDTMLKLNYYCNKHEYITQEYCELLKGLSYDDMVSSSLQGAYISLLFKNKKISYDDFESFVDQFVYGSIIFNNDCIGFFYSILKISKASIFYRNGILQLLNAYIASLQGEEFLKVLVMLKRSFASFSKEEIYKVVKLLQKIHGIAQSKYIFDVSAQEFAHNRSADRKMFAQLSEWLPTNILEDLANHPKGQVATTALVEEITGQDLSRSSLLSIDKRPQGSSKLNLQGEQSITHNDDILLDETEL